MKVPIFDPNRSYAQLADKLEAAALRVLRSGKYILGAEVENFEQAMSKMLDDHPVVGVSSGTDALVLALASMGIGPGDEVITSPFSFIATPEAIAAVGATPIFADIDPKTCLLDASAIREQLSSRTRAVLTVHLYGDVFDPEPLQDLWDSGIDLIEDTAQAQGAKIKGKPAGTLGAAGCFSFFPSKILGGFGDGGAICFKTEDLANEARSLRVHGRGKRAHFALKPGYNARLDAIQAAMLNEKLPGIFASIEARRGRASRYAQYFSENELFAEAGVTFPDPDNRKDHVFNYYVIQVPGDKRESMANYLRDHGVATNSYYPIPLHLQPAMGKHRKPEGSFPAAEHAAQRALAIPLFPGMSDEEQDYVVHKLFESMRI